MFRIGQAFFERGLPFWGSAAAPEAFGPSESHGFLKSVEAASGEEEWAIESEHPALSGVLATAGGLVFWGDAEGTFHATDAKTGKDLWTYNLNWEGRLWTPATDPMPKNGGRICGRPAQGQRTKPLTR
jgi:lanthanide-dependent methanol dehydrogenase